MTNQAKKPTENKQTEGQKMPDFQEIKEMATKLINDVKQSVSAIYQDYKLKHNAASNDANADNVQEKPEAEEVKAKKEDDNN